LARNPRIRTCLGCREKKDQSLLIRTLFHEAKGIYFSLRIGKGRGAYLCPRKECFLKACKKRAFSRAFKRKIEEPFTNHNDLLREARGSIKKRLQKLSSATKESALKKRVLLEKWLKELKESD